MNAIHNMQLGSIKKILQCEADKSVVDAIPRGSQPLVLMLWLAAQVNIVDTIVWNTGL